MTRSETDPRLNAQPWSAHNLPRAKTPPMLAFAVLAVAAGLVAIVLGTAVSGPIRTSGTKMEPSRFQSTLNQAAKSDAASADTVVVASTN